MPAEAAVAPSLAIRLALAPPAKRDRFIRELEPIDAYRLLWEWRFWARPNQLAPTDPEWVFWLILAGRGFGKSRLAAEWVHERVDSGEAKNIGIIGP